MQRHRSFVRLLNALGAMLLALAAFAIQNHLYPEKKQFLQYTTTSPIMQKRLGVNG